VGHPHEMKNSIGIEDKCRCLVVRDYPVSVVLESSVKPSLGCFD